MSQPPPYARLEIYLRGAFEDNRISSTAKTELQLVVDLHLVDENDTALDNNIAQSIEVQLKSTYAADNHSDTLRVIHFDIEPNAHKKLLDASTSLRIEMHTTPSVTAAVPIQIAYDDVPINKWISAPLAAMLLLFLYTLIIWDIVHRTLAAILASTMSIAVLAALDAKPTMPTIISWIDVETLMMLFGMMIIVAISSESGIFEYLTVYAYKITGGRVWPLVGCLCASSACLSIFLDSVTTVLLMAPIIIRLCEVIGLNPVPVLTGIIIFANVGGASTPVGDPPNLIILSNAYVADNVSADGVYARSNFPDHYPSPGRQHHQFHRSHVPRRDPRHDSMLHAATLYPLPRDQRIAFP